MGLWAKVRQKAEAKTGPLEWLVAGMESLVTVLVPDSAATKASSVGPQAPGDGLGTQAVRNVSETENAGPLTPSIWSERFGHHKMVNCRNGRRLRRGGRRLVFCSHQLSLRGTTLWLVGLLCGSLAGCGDRLASLQGTVTVNGQVAPKGLAFEFSPLGPGSPSYGTTDAEGRYVAAFTFKRKGIEPGEHLVRLLPSQIEMPMPEFDDRGRLVGKPKEASPIAKFPREYYEQITTIVVSEGYNTHDFELVAPSE